jgi:hypothetical protein
MIGEEPWHAVIDPGSPRYAMWLEIMGGDVAPIETPDPHHGFKPDGAPARFLLVDRARVDPARLERAAAILAMAWGRDFAEILDDIRGPHGWPILYQDVRACRDPEAGRAWFARRARALSG